MPREPARHGSRIKSRRRTADAIGMNYRLAFDITDHESGRTHALVLSGGIWHHETLLYQFMLPSLGIAGRIECECASSGPRYQLEQGEVTSAEQRRVIERVTMLMRPFFDGAYRGISDEQLAAMYPGDYHERSGYCDSDSEVERELKGAIAEMVVRTLRPEKVLDAGCAGGLLVRELRRRGVDAHGFDHCPDLERIVVPEARSFVRRGGVTNIPYGPEDGFDTLVCIDVFEHVPEDRIPAMVAEFDRIGVRHLAVHISHTELEHFGHITLRPLSWWDRQLGLRFRRAHTTGGELLAIPRPLDPMRVLRIYQRVETPIELRPAAARGAGSPAAAADAGLVPQSL